MCNSHFSPKFRRVKSFKGSFLLFFIVQLILISHYLTLALPIHDPHSHPVSGLASLHFNRINSPTTPPSSTTRLYKRDFLNIAQGALSGALGGIFNALSSPPVPQPELSSSNKVVSSNVINIVLPQTNGNSIVPNSSPSSTTGVTNASQESKKSREKKEKKKVQETSSDEEEEEDDNDEEEEEEDDDEDDADTDTEDEDDDDDEEEEDGDEEKDEEEDEDDEDGDEDEQEQEQEEESDDESEEEE